MPANGGVVMVTFVAGFISSDGGDVLIPAIAEFGRRAAGIRDEAVREALSREIVDSLTVPSPPLEAVADHVEHVAAVAGYDHVGIGGDYDGNRSGRSTSRTSAATRTCSPSSSARVDRGQPAAARRMATSGASCARRRPPPA